LQQKRDRPSLSRVDPCWPLVYIEQGVIVKRAALLWDCSLFVRLLHFLFRPAVVDYGSASLRRPINPKDTAMRSRLMSHIFTRGSRVLPMPASREAIEVYQRRLDMNRRWVLFAMHSGEGQARMLELVHDSEAMLLTLRQLILGVSNPAMLDQTIAALRPLRSE
jgi:hypothetical protein